jgi:hypothetical protein
MIILAKILGKSELIATNVDNTSFNSVETDNVLNFKMPVSSRVSKENDSSKRECIDALILNNGDGIYCARIWFVVKLLIKKVDMKFGGKEIS